uniref:Uncharacterized protein n=1 Tax=Nelumbo nucifera TaxID=4432 RepID=A0A822Z6F8_NELNU|nr:TPA_asm: hypothetical protein HUJ06_014965 [Nelumbo nucifera]
MSSKRCYQRNFLFKFWPPMNQINTNASLPGIMKAQDLLELHTGRDSV